MSLILQGLKANLKRLYNLITEQQFARCHKQDKYKKLMFCLCFFHSVLLERKKFLMLGWNIAYEFNDSDFEVIIVHFSSLYVCLSVFLPFRIAGEKEVPYVGHDRAGSPENLFI